MLVEAAKALAVAVAVLSILVPAVRVIRVLVQLAMRLGASRKQIEDSGAEEAQRVLTDASNERPVIEGTYERVQTEIKAIESELGRVEVRP